MTASPRSNPSSTAAARLGLNTPLAEQLDRLPDLPNKPRPLWQRIVAGILLTSSLLVHTGQVLAQYQYGNGAYNPNGSYNPSPQTGYAPNGQLYLAGQPYKEPQAHIDARNVANSVLYNALVKGLSEPTATNPGFIHGTLSEIDSAAAILGGGAVRSATVIYFTTNNNIYGVNGGLNSPPPAPTPANPNQLANYNTYKDILTNAPGAGYQTVVAPPNAPNTPAVPYVNGPYLIKTADGSDGGLAGALFYNAPFSTLFELAQSTQTPTGSSLIGGGVAANLNQDQTQVNHLAALSGGLVFASQAWIDPNSTDPNNLGIGNDIGYFNRQGQVVALNTEDAYRYTSIETDGGTITNRQAWLQHLNQQAQKLDRREGYQIQANSLDLSGYNPTDLFRDGYDLYKYDPHNSQGASQNELLRRLQNGQLTPGSDEYNRASQIAQERYRTQYWVHLEYNTKLKFSKEDAQRKANQLQLSSVDATELFNQGLDLFKFAQNPAERNLLQRLKNGEIQAGSAEYDQAKALAEQRFRDAYAKSLEPPKSIPKWKLIVGAVVGAVLTFVTAGALAPILAGMYTGLAGAALTTALATGGVLAAGGAMASVMTVATAIAGVVAGAVGTLASTTITTGSLSQGIRAAGNSLVSGSVSAIVGAVIGVGFDFAGLSNLQGTAGTISTVAQNTLSGAVSQTILGNGSFADNLQSAAINSVVNAASASAANAIGANSSTLGVVGTEIAHGVLGCATGMVRAGSSDGCVPGATGAVVGHLGAGWIDAASGYTLNDNTLSFFSTQAGSIAAAAVGSSDQVEQNLAIGGAAASNAVDNNYLTTRDLLRALDALRTCTVGCDSIRRGLGVNQQSGGEQTTTGNLEDACRAGRPDCAGRVQDIKTALDELQKPETRALLGERNAQALIDRQVKDIGVAVNALQWGSEHEASSRLVVRTALTVAATAAGAGLVVNVGRALIAACASGAASPTCVTATTDVAIAAMEAAGGVPTVGITVASVTAAANRLASNAATAGQDVNAVVRGIQNTQANLTPMTTANSYRYIGANGTFVTPVSAFESVLGPIAPGVTQIAISKSQATALETSLGLPLGTLETKNILSIIEDIPNRSPRSPTKGNDLFLGAGKGLPGGFPESVIDAIPSAGGNGIRQIIVKIK